MENKNDRKKDKELINNNLHLTINQMVDFFNKKYTRKEIKNFLSNNNISCQKENKETQVPGQLLHGSHRACESWKTGQGDWQGS